MMLRSFRWNDETTSYCLLVLALATALTLVLPGLASSPLGIDEHVSYWIAGAENPGTLCERSLNYAATPPLSSIVQRGFLGLGGKLPFWIRLPSVISFLCAIGFTFLFARDVLGPLPAGLAVQLLVWHPDVIDRMRIARPYALSVALAAALMWLTWRWYQSPRNVRLMLCWTATAVALAWTHYLNLPLVALLVLWLCGFPLLRSEGQHRPGWLLLIAVILFVAAIVPLSSPLNRLQEWSSVLNFRQAPPPLWQGIGPYWWLTLPVGFCTGWLLTRAFPGQTIPLPPRRHLLLLILVGCLPVVLFAVLPAGSLSALAEPRYRLIYAPATAVLMSGLLMRNRNLMATLLSCAVGIGGTWWFLGECPWDSKELTVPAAADWTKLTVQLQKTGQPNEPVFVYSGLVESRLVPALFEDGLFHDYVCCRAGRFIVETPHPRYALPWSWTPHAPLTAYYNQALQKARTQGITIVWLIASLDTDLGRETVERFGVFVAGQRYHESERMVTPNAVLIKFERND